MLIVIFSLVVWAESLTAASNCPYFKSDNGPNCTSSQYCCGYSSMRPTCLDISNKTALCCTYRIAATVCVVGDSCCGAYGFGASSYAFCCTNGTTCCQTTYDGGSSCCASNQKCCRGFNAKCVEADQECPPN